MIRAVVKDHAEIHCRKSREHSLLPRFLNALFNSGNEISRNRAAENFVHEFEVAAARQRLHADLAVAILAVAAALFLVLALNVGLAFDRFAIRNFRRMQQHFHAVSLLQTRDRHFHVHLPLAGKQEFLRLRLAHVSQAKILVHQLVDRGADLVFVTARLRFDRERDHGLDPLHGRNK